MPPHVDAVVAGHICLDIIPALRGLAAFEPGRLVEAGPATLSTGGAVSNTGLALAKLGIATRLVGKVGDDHFGRTVREILDGHHPGLGSDMAVVRGEPTSYTVVLNLAGHDRMFLHCPGSNDTFTAADVSDEALEGARLFHFGYPPLMARMYADGSAELERLFARAKGKGLMTSLDLSLPDAESPSGRADWGSILRRVLPYVDIFMPSYDELRFMLGEGSIPELADRARALGCGMVGVKAGAEGLFLRTGERSLHVPCFRVEVVGTTGAGDATIAGFLMAILRGMSLDDAATAAVAVGACCCESADAVSGVQSWEDTKRRIDAGWGRR